MHCRSIWTLPGEVRDNLDGGCDNLDRCGFSDSLVGELVGRGRRVSRRSPLTSQGYARLSEELVKLKREERPRIRKALEEARAHGDLSENAEYQAAREHQGLVEARIRHLQFVLSHAEVFDPSSMSGEEVRFGATVRLIDEDAEKEVVYRIVGQDEADIKTGRLSVSSPVSRALIGRKLGDQIEVRTPGGIRVYQILDISWK